MIPAIRNSMPEMKYGDKVLNAPIIKIKIPQLLLSFFILNVAIQMRTHMVR
jgi:hypothetical protein